MVKTQMKIYKLDRCSLDTQLIDSRMTCEEAELGSRAGMNMEARDSV
jgi:hypothetical protein